MNTMRMLHPLPLLTSVLCGSLLASAAGEPVRLVKTPENGVQPSAAIGPGGVIHLIYLVGEEGRSDVHYARLSADGAPLGAPVRVNSQPGAAVAVGTIRGPQLALGRNQRPHVIWNGNGHRDGAGYEGSPLLYTRLAKDGRRFEPQRDLIHSTSYLDGGASISADPQGNVRVLWHGLPAGATPGEGNRSVVMAQSVDDGATFAPERPIRIDTTGACGCCGMQSHTTSSGNVLALFRNAATLTNRNMVLALSADGGAHFTTLLTDPWNTPACPMSSAAFAETPSATLAAWETAGQVRFSAISKTATQATPPAQPPGRAARKHPAIAGNGRGEILLAWTEDTAWKKGGKLAWQLFDAQGKPAETHGLADGVPVWGSVAAVALPDESFLIVY